MSKTVVTILQTHKKKSKRSCMTKDMFKHKVTFIDNNQQQY